MVTEASARVIFQDPPTHLTRNRSMNSTPADDRSKDAIVTSLGLLTMLLGAATGNAYAMFAISVTALIGIAIFLPRRPHRTRLFALTLVAAAAAAVVAAAISKF
jgi:hypothetical protein